MKKVLIWSAALVAVLVVLALSAQPLVSWYMSPPSAFNLENEPPAPNYDDNYYWVAHPDWQDTSDLIPPNVDTISDLQDQPVDVFFVHSTGYVGPGTWNSTMRTDKAEAQSIQYMLSSMASIFNGCCRIYAPHYREATIQAFLSDNLEASYQALDLAYRDVEQAFLHYLEHENNGRPFMLVSHSQGTLHGLRLLAQHVDAQAIEAQFVAAYALGYWLPRDKFDTDFTSISLCETAQQTGCIVSYDTYGEGGYLEGKARHWYKSGWKQVENQPIVCVNPLSWTTENQRYNADMHLGAMPVEFKRDMLDMVLARNPGFIFSELPPLVNNFSWAQCGEGGELFLQEQLEGPFANHFHSDNKSYHLLDFSLFYGNLRHNAIIRTNRFLKKQ